MYVAKRRGGSQTAMFAAPLQAAALRALELEQELHAALRDGGQLSLEYQPIVRLPDEDLLGFEALARWGHPRLGRIEPGEFIPVAEKTGIILPLGAWVLRQAVGQARSWQEAFPRRPFFVSVNVSPPQLREASFVGDVAGLLAEAGVPASRLCLEVTEGTVLDRDTSNVLCLARQSGLRVAIDDFGVGYSSLSYLRRLPAGVVKLDRSFLHEVGQMKPGRSFLHGLGEEADQEAFLESVIRLAHAARLSVVAEGVETTGQLEVLRRLGCDSAQGFLFGRAMSAARAGRLLETMDDRMA